MIATAVRLQSCSVGDGLPAAESPARACPGIIIISSSSIVAIIVIIYYSSHYHYDH